MADFTPGAPVHASAYSVSSTESGAPSGPVGAARGNGPRSSITTSMLSLWDSNQNGLKFNVAILDTSLSVAIWIPHVGTDGRRTYPKDQRYSAVISQKNCIALEDMIMNHLLIDYAAGKNSRYGIFTNAARSTLLEFECLDGEFYAILHLGCDATTKVAQSTVKFKFEGASFIKDYDSTTGLYDSEIIQADFYLFIKTLQGFNCMAAGLIAGHGYRAANGVDAARLMNYIQAIANAVHAQLPNPSFQPMGTIRQIPGNATPVSPTPTLTEVNDLSDLVG